MRKKVDLPTTYELESLINNLKLSKPESISKAVLPDSKDNYASIQR
jgi:hypothetical protein